MVVAASGPWGVRGSPGHGCGEQLSSGEEEGAAVVVAAAAATARGAGGTPLTRRLESTFKRALVECEQASAGGSQGSPHADGGGGGGSGVCCAALWEVGSLMGVASDAGCAAVAGSGGVRRLMGAGKLERSSCHVGGPASSRRGPSGRGSSGGERARGWWQGVIGRRHGGGDSDTDSD